MKKFKQTISSIITAGTSTLQDHDAQKRITIGVNVMCFSIIAINSTIGVLAYLMTKQSAIITGITIEMAASILPILLNKQRKYLWASLNFFLIVLAATCYFSSVLGKSAESQLMIIYLIGVALFLFDKLAIQITCVALSVCIIIFVEWNFDHELIKAISIDPGIKLFIRWAVYATVILLVVITFSLYKRNNTILLQRLQGYSGEIEVNLQKKEKENKIKDRFIGNATHEMKVSFHSIFAIINILYKIEKKVDVPDLKLCIDDLRAACKISKSIIDNILEYEKYEAGTENIARPQLIDIRLVFYKIIDIYKYLANERNVNISLVVAKKIPQHIMCDEVMIRHIITNLLHNAIKFTRNGTTITIRIDTNYHQLSIRVEDQGEGISLKNTDAIFEPFYTQNPEGLGLGLYIVKKLVSALDGKISIKTSNEGSHFCIGLPYLNPADISSHFQPVGLQN